VPLPLTVLEVEAKATTVQLSGPYAIQLIEPPAAGTLVGLMDG
jgi:hypothetical protein